jgi:hypothetical protein
MKNYLTLLELRNLHEGNYESYKIYMQNLSDEKRWECCNKLLKKIQENITSLNSDLNKKLSELRFTELLKEMTS